jgi:DNA polymerase III epsilon subunit-like protein
MTMQEMYFSVDIEANGPIPGEFSMTALGACVVGRPETAFYAELRPLHDRFDPKALAVGGLTMEHLREKGEEPVEALRRFDAWVRGTAGNERRPVFVAFNATFDWMFLHWYLVRFLGSSPFGISGLDMKAYFMGLTGGTWGSTRKAGVLRMFPAGLPHTHNALDDAREQAEIFSKMLAARLTKGI